MTSQITLYLSQLAGRILYHTDGKKIGRIKDLIVDISSVGPDEPIRPFVVAVKLKCKGVIKYLDARFVKTHKSMFGYELRATGLPIVDFELRDNQLLLMADVLDKQLVDINGRKLVRVNDVRLVAVDAGIFALAVDVGIEGLLRRLGVVFPLKKIFNALRIPLPSRFILWDDVEAVDFSTARIRLSKAYSKLEELHPSDLADIIEELGKATRTDVFCRT